MGLVAIYGLLAGIVAWVGEGEQLPQLLRGVILDEQQHGPHG